MKKSNHTLYVIMNFFNYVLVFFAVVFYSKMMPLYPVLLILQFLLVVANFTVSKKIWQLSILSGHLLVSTIVTNIMATALYMHNISGDAETLLVGKYATIIGSVYVITLSLVAIAIKYIFDKRYSH